jgi:nucleoid DNA-binding protein
MAPRTTKPAAEKPAKPVAKAKAVAKTEAKPAKAAPQPKPDAKAVARSDSKASAKSGTAAFKLRDLVEVVAAATGAKKPEVKQTIEATLSALADALKSGADLNLPPLGRARIAKAAGKDGAAVMTLKLRLGGAAKSGANVKTGPKQALADDGEDS